VVEGEVDDRVRGGRGLAQAVEVTGVAEADFGAEGLHGCGSSLGPGKARDLVPGLEKFGDDGRGDVAAGAGNEYAHDQCSRQVMLPSTVTLTW
jgi:hypothetical protein